MRTIICPSCRKSQHILDLIEQRILPYDADASEGWETDIFYHDTDAEYYIRCMYCHYKFNVTEVGLQYTHEDGWGELKQTGRRQQ